MHDIKKAVTKRRFPPLNCCTQVFSVRLHESAFHGVVVLIKTSLCCLKKQNVSGLDPGQYRQGH